MTPQDKGRVRRRLAVNRGGAMLLLLAFFLLAGCGPREIEAGREDVEHPDPQISQEEAEPEPVMEPEPVAEPVAEPEPDAAETGEEAPDAGVSHQEIVLIDRDGSGVRYGFSYHGEEFEAQYTKDNWKILASYRITDIEDMIAICQTLLDTHPVHGRDMQSIRTAEDMAFEWLQHNLAYELLPEDHPWRQNAGDVDLNPEDQGRTLAEMYEDRTGRPFRWEDFAG